MNKYNDRTLDVNLEVAAKIRKMADFAIKAAKEKEGKSNRGMFEPGALGRVEILQKRIAGNKVIKETIEEELEIE